MVMEELDENVQIFISEAVELLEEMETALLELESSNGDEEILGLIFRAAHTIKGSAGLFGFDHIIEFTHVVENVLDDMRNCIIPISSELITTLMRSKDQIGALIDALPVEDSFDAAEEKEIIDLLKAFQQGGSPEAATNSESSVESSVQTESKNNVTGTETTNTDEETAQSEHYHISIRLGSDTFRQGFEPIAMFKQLADLGTLKEIIFLEDSIPTLDKIDSESCYMGWEIALKSNADKEQISEIFEFIEGASCNILPPKSNFSAYQHMIEQLPDEDELALGQMLIRTGTLTEHELQQVLNQQKGTPELVGDLLIENKMVQEEVVEQALEKQKKVKAKKQQALSFVKVDSAKLDKLVNLVGELVINGAKMGQLSEKFNDDDLSETMEGMMLSLNEMRETALGLRMIPIGATFNRFHRVVRDISKDLNKDIRLEIYGADTELDKTVIEKIADPLMHLVRNSLDHGIEMPDERERTGKDREGMIKLNAHHEAGMIVIEITDDGKGLDADKLLEKGLEKGLVKEGQKLSHSEIYNLIFEAGFSMAKEISNISGRGVGMDVVRRNIESLRGSININSEKGSGTTISIQLPLTLAIIDGFHVQVNKEDFIIPLDMIKECVTLNEAQVEETSMHDYITLREEVLPLIQLTNFFAIDRQEKRIDTNKNDADGMLKRRHENVVVVQFGSKKVGMTVDTLLGETQAVIKPMGRIFKGLNGFAGFTILGSGHVALVMDVPGLVKDVVSNEKKQFMQADVNSIPMQPRIIH
jgi:two-component system, chemotaxis family, sensor kinase CheA